ncbi:FAD-binding protein [Nonomuraea sp. GTA35]|uniref:FAD-binding protein n=1 Tax=Nonomuraea sp. GTA35 TaxID=1676746 RepID=UPI0035BEBD60
MEVGPTSPCSMGGGVVGAETTATDLTGRYAAGEVTAGVHGANRLGGNPLAGTVLGAIARRETRDCHNRSDHPELDETLTKTLEVSVDDPELLAGSRALLEPTPELVRPGRAHPDLDPTGRLTS